MRLPLRPAALVAAGLLAATAALTPVLAASSGPPSGPTPDYPVPYTFAAGIAAAADEPIGTPPPGANDWSCKPSAAHPEPVILVHGLLANMTDNWQTISPLLADNGYCVFALTYGTDPGESELGGLVPMEQSAQQLSTFVQKVLAATGASKVDLVGHSEGATMPDYYVKFLGGAAYVDHYIGLSSVLEGTTFYGLAAFEAMDPSGGASLTGSACASCTEFLTGSAFMDKLDAGGAAVPGVTYTLIETKYDELVVPYTNSFVTAPNVTDITLQDQCPLDAADHVSIAADPIAAQDVLNALDAAHAKAPACVPVAPVVG
jgi:triacylglycerol lipase